MANVKVIVRIRPLTAEQEEENEELMTAQTSLSQFGDNQVIYSLAI